MASCRKCNTSMTNNAAARLCVVAALLALGSVAGPVKAQDFCPTDDLVYPYWSICTNPAVYNTEYSIMSEVAISTGLAPEWDESNSTYYVRLSDEPASYQLVYAFDSTETRSVAQGEVFKIVNVDTSRSLAWRQEGDENFLIEADSDAATSFHLLKYEDAVLPCPRIYGARCEAYNLYYGGAVEGLSAYEEDGVTYFKLDFTDLQNFVIVRISSSSTARPLSQNVISTVL